MTATNHALTGAIIGFTVAVPVAFVVAVLSHFVLDALPHFGTTESVESRIKNTWFEKYLIAEFVICVSIVLFLRVQSPSFWFVPAVCAFLAASPDLVTYRKFSAIRGGRDFTPNIYERFASNIQWFEKPIGAVVEVAWLISAIVLLAILI